MPFRLINEDFVSCTPDEAAAKRLSERFAQLRDELTPYLERDPVLKMFVRYKHGNTSRTSSPYVPNYWIMNGGGYRPNSWVGFAERRYADPRAGLQFQFVMRRTQVDFEIWLEGTYALKGHTARPATKRLLHEWRKYHVRQIRSKLARLGPKYWLWANRRESEPVVDDAVTHLEVGDIRSLLDGLSRGYVKFALGTTIPKERALKIRNVPTKIVEMTRAMLTYYRLCGGLAGDEAFEPHPEDTEGGDGERGWSRRSGPWGEGEEHRKLKLWVYNHPEFLGVTAPRRKWVDPDHPYQLPTGDLPDVVFSYGKKQFLAAEIETYNPGPGAYQAVKYRSLICAQRGLRLSSPSVRVALVAYRFDPKVKAFCRRYEISYHRVSRKDVK